MANQAGFLVQLNHPRWGLQTIRDYGPLKGLWGFEVFNGTHAHLRNGWANSEYANVPKGATCTLEALFSQTCL